MSSNSVWTTFATMAAMLVVVAVFSAPGFEDLMRCESVLPNKKSTPISPEEYKRCEHQGHVVYKEPEGKAQE